MLLKKKYTIFLVFIGNILCITSYVPRSSTECSFECDGICLTPKFICDGVLNCADGSDEMDCEPDQFTCHNELKLDPSQVCDGVFDCAYGSDEVGCYDERTTAEEVTIVNSLDTSPDEIKQFRSDYTYDARAEGWFKVHPIPVDWQTARLICHFEGAELASPLNADMLESIKELVANHEPKLTVYFSGVHQTLGNGIFTSIEGIPLEKLHIPNWYKNEPNNFDESQDLIVYSNDGTVWDTNKADHYPYICYRKYSKSDKLTECGTIDEGYKLDNRTGSCYKFHNHAVVWKRAHQICQAEGAYLAIINSKTEAEVLTDIYYMTPRLFNTQLYLGHGVAIGYRAWGQNGIWWTVHGQTLEEAGFEVWGDSSLDGKPYAGTNTLSCGSFHNRGLQAISCDTPFNFICEKTVESLIN